MNISRHRVPFFLLLLLFSILVLGGTIGAHAGEVFLKASVIADSHTVFLSDIAEVAGYPTDWKPEGHEIISVEGPTIISADFVRQSLVGTPFSGAILVGGPVLVIPEQSLAAPLSAIANEIAYPYGAITVSGLLEEDGWQPIDRVILRPVQGSGTLTVKASLYLKERELGRATATLTFREHSAKALTAISRGQEITPDTYVYSVSETMSDPTDRWIPGLEGARYAASATISPGEIITARSVKKVLDVTYGQRLRAILSKGAVSLSMQAVASGSGVVGETVAVRILDTGKRIQAVIVSEGEVYAELP